MKKSKKIILAIVLAVVIVIVALVAACAIYINGVPVTHKGLDYAEKYRADESGDCVYFTEEDFGNYEDITYEVKDLNGIFRSVGSMYTVTYSQEQYADQIEKVNAMNFIDESTEQNGHSVIPGIIPAEKVQSDGWLLRILDNGKENDFPKQIAMIATKDEDCTIVYLCFTDTDLDYISETAGEEELQAFIEKYFSFEF